MMDKFTIIRSMIDSQGARPLPVRNRTSPQYPRLCRRHSFHRRLGIERTGTIRYRRSGSPFLDVSDRSCPMGRSRRRGISGQSSCPFSIGGWQRTTILDRKRLQHGPQRPLPRTTARPSCLEKVIRPLQAKGRKNGIPRGYGEFEEKALGILSSSALSDALDLSRRIRSAMKGTANRIPNGGPTGLPR